MQVIKPTLLKGTQDFGALEVFRRHYIINTARHAYEKYGFSPLETPALEHLETLTGKYGQEGDQLLFKILNSGDFLEKVGDQYDDYKALLPKIASKGLRYDLTVPLMRYVVMNRDKLTFPFKRYQIQPVWRADRPQKGRYREFYQCDVDIVGTSSLLCEAEILVLAHEVLRQLGIKDFSIQLNHRGLLKGLATLVGAPGQEEDLCVTLDKLDKVGKDSVLAELRRKGFDPTALNNILFIFDLPAAKEDRWECLAEKLTSIPEAQGGLEAMRQILAYVETMGLTAPSITIDPTLARGLSYYTGAVFEVKAHHLAWGSIGGGGRYDGLTDIFGLPGISGVGFSFGLDRLYGILKELNLFPADTDRAIQVLLTNLDTASMQWALEVMGALRAHNIRAECYPDAIKLKKQLHYAHKRQIPFVAILGEEERVAQMVTLKDMQSGTQQQYSVDELIQRLSQL